MATKLSRRALLAAAEGGALWMAGCRASSDATSSAPARSAEARSVAQVVPAQATRDGAGVALRRAIGSRLLPLLDPFLLLDEIRSERADEYIKGFPDHPHRGFETVTLMIDGAMEHRDSVGNQGRLVSGSVQWMTAGRGIVHSEMPKQERGLLWGFQLWVNLPRKLKMSAPRYQDIAPARIPEVTTGAGFARVLAGSFGGETGPVEGIVVAPTMLDLTLSPGGVLEHSLPATHNAFVFVMMGDAALGPEGRNVAARELAVLGPGNTLVATGGSEGARLLLVAAEPIGEPVARRGPFVMNTEEELDQAFEDYRSGRLVGG